MSCAQRQKKPTAKKAPGRMLADPEAVETFVSSLPEAEANALRELGQRQREARPAPRAKVGAGKDGGVTLEIDHEDEAVGMLLLANAFGCASANALSSILNQLVQVAATGQKPSQQAMDFLIATASEIKPRDPVESMLAIQMAAAHLAVIRHSRMLAHVETLPQLEVQERTVNKLMRTFATQTEALRKYRSGGQQHVEVRHVHVNEGGQAIIGNVSRGGGDGSKN